MPGMIDTPLIYEEIMKLYNGDMERMRRDRNARVPMISLCCCYWYFSLFKQNETKTPNKNNPPRAI